MSKRRKSISHAADAGNEMIVAIRDGIGVVFFSLLATGFFETEHKQLGAWCTFVGLAAALHVPFYRYAINKPRDQNVMRRYWILNVILFVACCVWVYTIPNPKPEPHPHFILTLESVDSTEVNVALTNKEFFALTNFNRTGFVPSMQTVLLIPAGSGDSNIKLGFSVKNVTDETASDVEVIASFRRVRCIENSSWTALVKEDPSAPQNAWTTRIPMLMYPTDRSLLGPLEFPADLRKGDQGSFTWGVAIFALRANGNGSDVTDFKEFTVVFFKGPTPPPAGVYISTNPPPFIFDRYYHPVFNPGNNTYQWIHI